VPRHLCLQKLFSARCPELPWLGSAASIMQLLLPLMLLHPATGSWLLLEAAGALITVVRCAVCCCLGCAVEYSPFYGIEKGAVLQEARIFHDPNLDTRRCSQVGWAAAVTPTSCCSWSRQAARSMRLTQQGAW
jgi:hypothetical protein